MRHCEMVGVLCLKPIEKTVIGTNVFGEEMRLGLCAAHVIEFQKPEVRQRLLEKAKENWESLGSHISPNDLHKHPAQVALVSHELTCHRCAAVRDWVVVQQQQGLIRTQEDINRVGLYSIEHCCEIGLKLREEIGKAMKGLT